MKRWLPFPLAAGALLAVWLLITESVTPGSIILGAVLALATALLLTLLDVPRTRLRRPGAALRLAIAVLAEVVRSNLAVGRIILRPRSRERRSGFVLIPLATRNPYSLVALACIITATPGTIWVEYDSGKNTMLLHVLDLTDGDQWVEIVKRRYEAPLMEIFG